MNQETTRREALIYVASAAGVLATAAGAGSAHAQSGHRDSHMDDGEKKMSSHDLESCIDECRACHQLCVETIRYCLEKGGRHANPQHVGLLIDCAEICQTNSNFMMRRRPITRSFAKRARASANAARSLVTSSATTRS